MFCYEREKNKDASLFSNLGRFTQLSSAVKIIFQQRHDSRILTSYFSVRNLPEKSLP